MADTTIGGLQSAEYLDDNSLFVVETQGTAQSVSGRQVKELAAAGAEAAQAKAEDAAAKAQAAVVHSPVIGENGNWYLWDFELGDYVDSGHPSAGTGSGGGDVQSVNGKTGTVILGASDVGALPAGTPIPSKTSELTNDSGFITGYTETDPTVPAWAKAVSKPNYSKSEVGLGNVENVKQYSASNPPPYPVTEVNGKTGAVSLSAADVGAVPAASVVQETGDSTEAVMSQAAVTKELEMLSNEITDQTAIIDVVALPTEDIKEDVFYRLLTGKLVINQVVQNAYTCHCVNELPETGDPCTNAEQTQGTVYYNLQDEGLYGYVNDMLASFMGVPVGWYPGDVLLQALGFSYGGVITNITDDPGDGAFRLLLEYVLYSHKDIWNSMKSIGWAGTGASAEIFNDPSNVASGERSHAEGGSSHAEGNYSHAEGYASHAEGESSHAEGGYTHAEGGFSHAEGEQTHAEGDRSHAEGVYTHAQGNYSHAEGFHTHAQGNTQHVQGSFNIPDETNLHIVGNGYDDLARSNAHTLDWDGNAWFAGEVYVGSDSGTNRDGGSVRLAKTTELPTKTSQLTNDSGYVTADNIPQTVTIVQGPGESESQVMSQKAVTDLVADAIENAGAAEYETVDSVEEMTDTSKQYVLSTTGTVWAYGQTEPKPAYTNLATKVTEGYRLNSSGGLTAQTGAATVEDYITLAAGDVIRIKGFGALDDYNVAVYSAIGTVVSSSKPSSWSNNYTYDSESRVATITFAVVTNNKLMRVSGALTGTVSDVIITKNEPIEMTGGAGWYDTGMIPSTGGGDSGNYVKLAVQVNQNASDIYEMGQRVTALETRSETLTIPSFWQSAVDACISKIKALQVGRNCITFPFFSDNHQRNGYAGLLIAHIMKECNLPYCFYGGDSISSGTIVDEAEMIEQDKAFDTIMSYVPNGRLCRAVGNHDGYWYDGTNKFWYTREQVYELFLREESVAQNKHFGDDGTYYYVDDIASKTRFVILDTNGGSFDAAQLAWMQDTALVFDAPGWAVVFISHQPISNHYHAGISNAAEVRAVVKNYIDGSATNKADVVGWFSGHIHRDRIWTGEAVNTEDDSQGAAMGFTQVTITSDHTGIAYEDATKHTVANDNQSHAIDFVTINKAARTVNLTRLGIGNDRSYSF